MRRETIFLILMIAMLQGCGGSGTGGGDLIEHEPKEGYWEIQETSSHDVLYRGFFTHEGLVLNQDNESWAGDFLSTSTSTASTVTNIKYSLIGFGPSDFSQESITVDFPMVGAAAESEEIILNGEQVKLFFDPDNLHTTVKIVPSAFQNIAWVDQDDNNNRLTTTTDGSSFTLTSNKAFLMDSCIFTGDMPTTTLNYATIEAQYSCSNSLGASENGTTFITMATNATQDEILVAVGSPSENVAKHIILFK